MKLPDYPIPGESVRGSWGRQIVDYLRAITPRSSPSILVSTTANGSTFAPLARAGSAGDGGLDLSKCSLGYKINPDGAAPDLVRIYAGEIDRCPVGETDVTVTDGWYVYVRRTIATNAMLVTVEVAVPDDDETYLYYRLYKFAVTDGVASLTTAYRPFDIEVNKSGAIPAGGVQYQVLQRNADLDPVWDWVRWA